MDISLTTVHSYFLKLCCTSTNVSVAIIYFQPAALQPDTLEAFHQILGFELYFILEIYIPDTQGCAISMIPPFVYKTKHLCVCQLMKYFNINFTEFIVFSGFQLYGFDLKKWGGQII